MIDSTLRECPFCGNPAEIVDAEPFSFMPNEPTKKIRCSSEYCIGHSISVRFQPSLDMSVHYARDEWNRRRRKNPITFDEKYIKQRNDEVIAWSEIEPFE